MKEYSTSLRTGASPPEVLMSYPRHFLGGSGLTSPQGYNQCIQSPGTSIGLSALTREGIRLKIIFTV